MSAVTRTGDRIGAVQVALGDIEYLLRSTWRHKHGSGVAIKNENCGHLIIWFKCENYVISIIHHSMVGN